MALIKEQDQGECFMDSDVEEAENLQETTTLYFKYYHLSKGFQKF